MKIKEAFNLALKSLKKISLREKIFIIVITIIFLLILIPFTIYGVFTNEVSFLNENDTDLKIIGIYKDEDKTLGNQYYIDIIKNNEHVVYIDDGSRFLYGYLDKNNRYSDYDFEKAIDGLVPKVTKGKNIQNENEIICPEYFTSDIVASGVKTSELINMKDSIGKEIKLTFFQDKSKNDSAQITKSLTLVGTFDGDKIGNYDTCYMEISTFKEIDEITKTLNDSTYIPFLDVYVDSRKNIDEVNDYLLSQGLNSSVTSSIDDSFILNILFLSVIILIFVIIGSVIILFSYFKRYYKEEYKNIALLKALGYTNKDISKIILLESIFLIGIGLIISVILFILISWGFNIYFQGIADYRHVKISFPILPITIYYAIIIGLNYVIIKSDNYILDKMSVEEIVKNDIY